MSSTSNAPTVELSPCDKFLEECRTDIATQLSKIYTKLTVEQAKEVVEFGKPGECDFQINPGKANKFPAAKLTGKPKDFAIEWAPKFVTTNLITKVTAPNEQIDFIRFDCVHLPFIQALLTEVMQKKEKYGSSQYGQGKNVIVEFSSPNIAKIFHAGHLRSTILGNYLQNVYRATGHNVTSYNYLGDWGKQYGLLAVGFNKYGSRTELAKSAIRHLYDVYVKVSAEAKEAKEDDTPSGDAAATPAAATTSTATDDAASAAKPKANGVDDEARAYFARMEAGDAEALALWKEFRDLSIIEYKKIYARLNVSFDIFSGESQVGGGMEAAFAIMKDKNLLSLSKGATLIDLEQHKKGLGKCLVKKSDGTSLYLTRDVSAAKERHDKHHFDTMMYVVGAAQSLHFKQLFKVLELMGYDWAQKCQHIEFGMVTCSRRSSPPSSSSSSSISTHASHSPLFTNTMSSVSTSTNTQTHTTSHDNVLSLPDNDDESHDDDTDKPKVNGMSTRNAVFLEDILDTAKQEMFKIMKENEGKFAEVDDPEHVADVLGMSAVIIQDLTARRNKNYDFSWDRMLQAEGETGPYLQYAHARVCSILRKAGVTLNPNADLTLLTEPAAYALALHISKFPSTIERSMATCEPVTLVGYLFDLARTINSAFVQLQVKGSEQKLAEARLVLFESGRIVLNTGMKLLGLQPVERM